MDCANPPRPSPVSTVVDLQTDAGERAGCRAPLHRARMRPDRYVHRIPRALSVSMDPVGQTSDSRLVSPATLSEPNSGLLLLEYPDYATLTGRFESLDWLDG
jgi:hypothetical protein